MREKPIKAAVRMNELDSLPLKKALSNSRGFNESDEKFWKLSVEIYQLKEDYIFVDPIGTLKGKARKLRLCPESVAANANVRGNLEASWDFILDSKIPFLSRTFQLE